MKDNFRETIKSSQNFLKLRISIYYIISIYAHFIFVLFSFKQKINFYFIYICEIKHKKKEQKYGSICKTNISTLIKDSIRAAE